MLDEMDDYDELPGEFPEDDQGYAVHLVPVGSVDMNGYWCVVCMRFVPREEDGVLIHDDIPHPTLMAFNEDEFPQ